MKLIDINFPHDGTTGYTRSFITGKDMDAKLFPEVFKTLRKLARTATDTDDLIDRIVNSADLTATDKGKFFRAYVIAHERPTMLWKEIRAAFGDRCVKTESDAGGVKVGTDGFCTVISNLRGDGTTRIAVFDEEKEIYPYTSFMTFMTTVEGRFNIYSYDCGGEPAATLSGRYGVYAYDGLVAFVKWN